MPPIRAAALAVLSVTMGFAADSLPAQCWSILHAGVASEKAETRQQAAAAVGGVGLAPEPVSILEKLLTDVDPDVRQTAAVTLGQMKARHAIPVLRNAMNDEDPGVAFFAARALWDMGDLSGRDLLEEVMGKERSAAVGGGGVQGAVRQAKKELKNPRFLALQGAKATAGFVIGPFALGIGPAAELLKDSGAAARASSANLLAQHCNVESREAMEKRLAAESSVAVKIAIARSLGECGEKASIPILQAYLPDTRDGLKMMSAAAILRLSTNSAAPVSKKQVSSGH
jgi:HEAT repeat protein